MTAATGLTRARTAATTTGPAPSQSSPARTRSASPRFTLATAKTTAVTQVTNTSVVRSFRLLAFKRDVIPRDPILRFTTISMVPYCYCRAPFLADFYKLEHNCPSFWGKMMPLIRLRGGKM
jgi:hypothetical protein